MVTKSVCALVPCTAYDYIIAVCKAASLLTVTGDSVRPPETGLRKRGGRGRLSRVKVLAFRGATWPPPPPTMPAEKVVGGPFCLPHHLRKVVIF